MRRLPFALSIALTLFGCADADPQAQDSAERAAEAIPVVVYKAPTCGCCVKWAAHIDSAGVYAITERDVVDLGAVKTHLGVPQTAASCHTATVDGFVIEGHVPEADIARLLRERPDGVMGLSVPGMPIGSPGMEVPGQPADSYAVLALHTDGTTSVYATH